MRKLRLNAIEIGNDGNETGKTFSVDIPYQAGMESVFENRTYSAADAINRACSLFYGDGRKHSDASHAFCGRISEPARYTVESVIIEDSGVSDKEWSLKASPRQKAQKFLQVTEDVFNGAPLADSYAKQIPNDLLDVVNFFRGTDENMFSKAYYDRLLNKNRHSAIYVDKGDVVYDIGVGGGDQLIDLSDAVGSTGKIFGIDVYPEKLLDAEKKIKAHSLKNVQVSFGDGRDLSNTHLKYKGADEVLIFGVLEYLNKSNVDKLLNEAVKACKSDGKIIVGTTAQEYFLGSVKHRNINNALTAMIEKGIMPLGNGMEGTLFSREMIEDEFENRGLLTTIHSYSNKEVMPVNVMGEPEHIRNLPSEHFVVAKYN